MLLTHGDFCTVSFKQAPLWIACEGTGVSMGRRAHSTFSFTVLIKESNTCASFRATAWICASLTRKTTISRSVRIGTCTDLTVKPASQQLFRLGIHWMVGWCMETQPDVEFREVHGDPNESTPHASTVYTKKAIKSEKKTVARRRLLVTSQVTFRTVRLCGHTSMFPVRRFHLVGQTPLI